MQSVNFCFFNKLINIFHELFRFLMLFEMLFEFLVCKKMLNIFSIKLVQFPF
jgi:hypothetical protein